MSEKRGVFRTEKTREPVGGPSLQGKASINMTTRMISGTPHSKDMFGEKLKSALPFCSPQGLTRLLAKISYNESKK